MEPVQFPHTYPYRPNARKLRQLGFAGATGSVAMLGVALVMTLLGFPAPDFGALYGAFLNHQLPPDRFSLPWYGGMAMHLLGTVFLLPLMFDYLADHGILPNFRWLKGVLWGLSLWFLVEAVVKPAAGFGFFSSQLPNPGASVFFALLAWYVYGVTVEASLRVPVVHELNGPLLGLSNDDRLHYSGGPDHTGRHAA